jgi:hypothetical protein
MRTSRRDPGPDQLSLWSRNGLYENATYREPAPARPARKRSKPQTAPRKVAETVLRSERQPAMRARPTRRVPSRSRCRTGGQAPAWADR